MRKTEHMEVPFELKSLDDETGTFEGYASVFGNVDLGNDVVMPGAFKRTLDHSKGAIPILWFHDPSQPVGIGIEASEDAKGLLVKGQLDLNTQRGREVHSGMKMGYIQSMSIGYKAIGKEIKDGVRHLTELALPEYSLLTKGFAMNPEAAVESVKALDFECKAAADFSTALAAAVAQEELYDRRWKLTDALWSVQHDLEEDTELTPSQKVEAFRVSLSQFADAMAQWFAAYLAVDDSSGMMAASIELEAKLRDMLFPKQAPDDGTPTAPEVSSLDLDAVKLDIASVEAHLATLSL